MNRGHIAYVMMSEMPQKPLINSHSVIRKLVLILAVIEPIMTLPQIYEIWVKHQIAGVSLSTWSFYLFAAIVWTVYSIQIKDLPIFLSSSLWVITEGLVVLGLLIS
jgi:uncharacterized protein with PQ loop repeat